MKLLIVTLCVVSALSGLSAQAPAWEPSPGHTQIPIWSGMPPDAHQASGAEVATTTMNDHLVAGRPWTYKSNVSRPTMTVYSPKGKNTGAAVVVFPGGGYQILAIDLEGTEVCDWLTAKGITCVLLKYRVPNSGPSDFAVALYPGHLWIDYDKFELNPQIHVTRNTPPTFLLQAENDKVDNVNQSLVYYIALKNAGVPAEIHLYAEGGHAFGLRRTKLPIAGWPQLVETWLATIGMISE